MYLFKKYGEVFLCMITLLPLFFMNINSQHDWGDDYAMYLKEALLMAQQKDLNSHHFILNSAMKNSPPTAYPVGYPLLLLTFIKQFGLNIKILLYLQTAFTVLMGLGVFVLLRKKFSFIVCNIAILLLFYNPYLLGLKAEVLSDIPYCAFLYWIFYLYDSLLLNNDDTKVSKNATMICLLILLGVLLGFSMHIKKIGILLPIVFMIEFCVRHFRKKISLPIVLPNFIVFLCTLGIYLFIQWAYPIHAQYDSAFTVSTFYDNFTKHLTYYLEILFGFFKFFDVKEFGFLTVLFSSFFITSFIVGLINELQQKLATVYNLYFIAFVGLVCISNSDFGGYRIILPITFFIAYYSMIGLRILLPLLTNYPKHFAIVAGVLILILYRQDVCETIHPEKFDSPNDAVYQPLFNYIQTSLSEKDTISAMFPRTFCLYTNSCFYYAANFTSKQTYLQELNKFHTTYVIIINGVTEPPIVNVVANDTTLFHKVISANNIDLYSYNK
jgi:hypothetical protein